MKLFYLITLSLLFSSHSFAQFSVQTGYVLGMPQQKMSNNLNAVHQFKIAGMYQLPNELKMVQIGVETGLGNYANLRMPTTFTLGNVPTSTFVNYNSNTFQANAVVQVFLMRNFFISPYLTTKAGYQSWYSNITVEDPLDVDGCAPLDRKSILKDRTGTISYGGGFQIDMSKFLNIRQKGKHYLDFGVVQTRGGNLEYINTKKLKNHDHTPDTNPESDSKPLNMRFINVTSNVIHSHQVAEVYTTPLRLLEFKLSYAVKF